MKEEVLRTVIEKKIICEDSHQNTFPYSLLRTST